MSKDIQELLDLLKSEVGVDELPEDLITQIDEMWPEEPDTDDLFTQEDVDEIVQQRLARERTAHEQEVEELQDEMEDMVESRREKSFNSIWENTELTREEVVDGVKNYEDEFISTRNESTDEIVIPDWVIKMEAQDAVMEEFLEKLEEGED